MSKIPKHGATPLQFVVEESRGQAWRPVAWSYDQRAALAELGLRESSYARRVVQVVAVRLSATGPLSDQAVAIVQAVARKEYGPDRYDDDFPRPRGVTP